MRSLFICLIILIFSVSLLLFEGRDNFYDTHTKAICSGRTCRDFLVSCSGDEVVSLRPISGFVTFRDDWVDLRTDRKLC